MTIHVTWERVLAFIGAGALSLLAIWVFWGFLMLYLYSRGMKGK